MKATMIALMVLSVAGLVLVGCNGDDDHKDMKYRDGASCPPAGKTAPCPGARTSCPCPRVTSGGTGATGSAAPCPWHASGGTGSTCYDYSSGSSFQRSDSGIQSGTGTTSDNNIRPYSGYDRNRMTND